VTTSSGEVAATRYEGRPIFVFSTPPTPNGDLHLGHLSGPYLGADVFVRFQRMTGATAWHLTGSDDFQSYVAARARAEGRDPTQTAAHYSAEIAATLRLMDIEPDQYTVTSTDSGYRSGLRTFFSRLVESGSVSLREGPALVDADTGAYLYEVDVSGGCPHCGEPTGGNICEECGEPNGCVDIVAPRSAQSEAPPREVMIGRYSLPLHEFRAAVVAHHRDGRTPARLKELAGRLFARDRLDVAVTHPSAWGVPPPVPGADDQVIWVWPEMAFGFLHGIEALGRRLGRDWRATAPQRDWKIVHFFGYDNSFYHSVLYPVLYRLAFPQWTPDIDYLLNEFYLLDGEKFSTSRRHAIWGKEVLGRHSVDSVRFHLSRTRSEGRRTNFRRDEYDATLREILIGTWQRWLNDLGDRIVEHHAGRAPEPGAWTPEHRAFLRRLGFRLSALTECLSPDGFSLNLAAEELNGIVADASRFSLDEGAVRGLPDWTDEAHTAIALELAAARLLASCAAPVMPRFASRLAAALGAEPPAQWPRAVAFVAPGSRIDLAGQVFFGAAPQDVPHDVDPAAVQRATATVPPLLPWLRDVVRNTLQLKDDEAVDDRALVALGMESLHAVALQYEILEETGVDISIDDLFAARDVATLAGLLGERAADSVVPPVTEGVPG
jgi:methionyl-tRNA synthetase